MLNLRCILFFLFVRCSSAGIRDPWVENLGSFFDKEDCNKIVEAAEAFGFPNSSDSIDYDDSRSTVSWAIDVVLEQEIEVPEIASLYEKYLPKLRDLVADRKFKMNDGDTSEPTLDWVFLRKYSAGEERRMLKLHHDINLFTLNVALNDDFEGGGIFYHKNYDEWFDNGNHIPHFPREKLSYDYLENIKRQNTSEIVFPNLAQGDLLIHNNTLFHAIAPLEKGTRYSLVFFYDMHHANVKHLQRKPVPVRLENSFDFPVDLVVISDLVDEETPGVGKLLLEEDLDGVFFFEATTAMKYEIVDAEYGDVVFEFSVYDDLEEGEEHLIFAGPPKEDEHDADAGDHYAFIENAFTFPVELYWVASNENGSRERHLIDEALEERTELATGLGHQFIVVDKKTDEIVYHFEINDSGENKDAFHITVGPHKLPPNEGEL